MDMLKYNEDKRISACIFYDGKVYEEDSHLSAYILYLKANLSTEDFSELEYNDYEGIEVYEDVNVSYGEIQCINNENCFIFFGDDNQSKLIMENYKNKSYLLSLDSDVLINIRE